MQECGAVEMGKDVENTYLLPHMYCSTHVHTLVLDLRYL